MKSLTIIISLFFALPICAGGVYDIPVQLIELENQGRAQFLKNALEAIGVDKNTVKYSDFKTIIVGGDERGTDFKGALFIYNVILVSNDRKEYKCNQFLAVGNFDQRLTRKINCSND